MHSDHYTRLCHAGIQTEQMPSLCRYSTIRIGGSATCAAFPKNRSELLFALRTAVEERTPFWVIGKGSNVIFPDGHFEGTVIFTGNCREIRTTGSGFSADAGASLSVLAAKAQTAALGGLEFAAGIPGTVGGAVRMNAGAFDGEFSQICVSTEYFDTATGETKQLHGEEHLWGYRKSFYGEHPHAVVLSADLLLSPAPWETIREKTHSFAERRRAAQPLQMPSAGSVFRRPKGAFAGKLIEECGLKGYTVGGAQVSEKHAGFIVNRGGATAADVKKLTEEIQKRVLEQFGIRLECEIQFLSSEPNGNGG